MKLLIDECVDERLRLLFPGHECQTARFANLAGLKNGRLLEAAEVAGFGQGDGHLTGTSDCNPTWVRMEPWRRLEFFGVTEILLLVLRIYGDEVH
jgi:hypothetical protein